MVFSMAFVNVTTVFAVTGSKTVSSSGSMSIILQQNTTGDSSIVSFTVSGLPTNATVTKIEINPGSLTYQGAMLTNNLQLSSTNKSGTEIIA
jgi:hypothetical protein